MPAYDPVWGSLLPVLADAACAALDAPRPPLPVLADRVAAPQARIPLCALDAPRPLLPVLADFAAAPPFPHGLDAIRPSNAQPPPTSLHRGYSSTKPTDISGRRVVHSWRGAWAERRIRAMRTEQRDEAEGRCFDVVAVATAPPFVPGPCCVAHPSCGTAWKTRIFMQRKDRATGSKCRRERYARGFPQVCGQLDTSLYWCASIAR